MAAGWQEAATRQAELLCGRVRELLSSGAALLRSELGLDLGLEPALWPTWLILSAALVVLLLLTVLLWAAACGVLPGWGKRRAGRVAVEPAAESVERSAPLRSLKAEEPKKRSRKRPEKKPQPNGRAVAELQEEPKEVEEIPKPAAEIKTEKPKKNKKKAKTEVNPAKPVSSPDGKEPDDGAWETKISNREKRQQRRKDKAASDDSGSPGGVDPPAASTASATLATPLELPKSTAAAPVNQRKNKGEQSRTKATKGEAVSSQAMASLTETQAVNGRGWTSNPAKIPAPAAGMDRDNWTPLPKGVARRNPETTPWAQEVEGSWTVKDGRTKKHELNPVTLNMLSMNPTESKPVSERRDGHLKVDDEWSGLNGMAADPSSDWNAPSEVWGNYEDPQLETPTPPEEVLPEAVKGSDDDKEKEDSATAGNGKSKKKRKKKKKQGDDTGAAQQESEEPAKPKEAAAKKQVQRVQEKTLTTQAPVPPPEVKTERPTAAKKEKETVSPKPAKQVPRRPAEQEAPAKQANPPPPSQKKSEENWESPKQVKKKKVRRET
ncbi:protein LYRIC-like isoform X2 [Scleropages formosus]|uniref:protein LYRIC-like isoform X2 n=1 Tax=Scleropages formosus TaxID=113540 RepID=UPI0010FA64E2|nr:protein LYRIC isoform X2 [Scleropages formosus]